MAVTAIITKSKSLNCSKRFAKKKGSNMYALISQKSVRLTKIK